MATRNGTITVDGETYLSVERAGEHLGKKRATVFNYIKRYALETFNFPAQGKRTFLRKRDLDALLTVPKSRNSPKANARSR